VVLALTERCAAKVGVSAGQTVGRHVEGMGHLVHITEYEDGLL
jgi:hypothetical protein